MLVLGVIGSVLTGTGWYLVVVDICLQREPIRMITCKRPANPDDHLQKAGITGRGGVIREEKKEKEKEEREEKKE